YFLPFSRDFGGVSFDPGRFPAGGGVGGLAGLLGQLFGGGFPFGVRVPDPGLIAGIAEPQDSEDQDRGAAEDEPGLEREGATHSLGDSQCGGNHRLPPMASTARQTPIAAMTQRAMTISPQMVRTVKRGPVNGPPALRGRSGPFDHRDRSGPR